jgi:hypothetical protein
MSFYNLFSIGVIGVIAKLLITTWFLLAFDALGLIKDIFEYIDISSLELLVFDDTS